MLALESDFFFAIKTSGFRRTRAVRRGARRLHLQRRVPTPEQRLPLRLRLPQPRRRLRLCRARLARLAASADVVVTNADVPYAYDDLLEGPRAAETARNLSEKSFSAGVVSFNWSVRGRLSRILHHSVFLSDDPKQAWDRATTASDLEKDGRCPRPNFYVHAPARSDPSCAPRGCDSIMVLLPVGNAQDVAGVAASLAAPVIDESHVLLHLLRAAAAAPVGALLS